MVNEASYRVSSLNVKPPKCPNYAHPACGAVNKVRKAMTCEQDDSQMATLSSNEIRYMKNGRDLQPHTKGQVMYLLSEPPQNCCLAEPMETSLAGSYQLPLFTHMQASPDHHQSLTMSCTMTCMSYEADQD